ncbi:MAG: antibiotic biosynthesis monooxygenase [Kangiellaceae bacterium]
MFIVMFEFVVNEGCEKQFIEKWTKVTQGIYLFKGSLGSRLHRNESGELIAYAQWPDRQTWEKSNEIVMSDSYEEDRKLMFNYLDLEATKIVYKMQVETDCLQIRAFDT